MSFLDTHIIYFFIIIFSTICIWLSEHIYCSNLLIRFIGKKYNISLYKNIFLFLALMILIIPLIFRTCGADTNVYYYEYSNDKINDFDSSFSYLLMFIHQYISDPQIGLGVISAFTVVISVFSLSRLRENISFTLAFIAYVTCVYFYSYNYMRMLFALSFVFWGYSLCIEEKWKTAAVPFAIAPLFHLSTIVVFIIHIALMIFGKYRVVLLLLAIIALVCFLQNPFYLFSLIDIERYTDNVSLLIESSELGVGTIFRSIPILFIFCLYYNQYREDKRFIWLLSFAVANIIFSFLGYYVGVASRISNCILVFHVLYATPLFIKTDKSKTRNNLLCFLFVIYCFITYYIISGNFETMGIVPYY